jgi:hypothetical protein
MEKQRKPHHLHHVPHSLQGCGASVASALGPFNKEKSNFGLLEEVLVGFLFIVLGREYFSFSVKTFVLNQVNFYMYSGSVKIRYGVM